MRSSCDYGTPSPPPPTISGFTYMGCFFDDWDRDLAIEIGSPHDHATCNVQCAAQGQLYFSLQVGNHCFCDSTYGTPSSTYYARPDADCQTDGHPSYSGGHWANAVFAVIAPPPSPPSSPFCDSHALRFDPNAGGGDSEYQLNILPSTGFLAGRYRLSARAYTSSDYDGSHQLLHARFMTSGAFADLPVTTGGFPTARDEWQAVETSINCGDVPSRIEWYLGFPMSHTAGNVWVTDVQITAPGGEQLIPDGSFPGGAHPAAYSAGDSYGTYAVVPSCSFLPPPSPPSGYHLAPTLATDCDYGELVAQSECEAAVAILAARDGATPGRTMQLGSGGACSDGLWGDIPLGCSAQTGGDWASHYKSSGSNCPSAGYRLVCVAAGAPPPSPPQAYHLAPALAVECDYGDLASQAQCEGVVAILAARASATPARPMQIGTGGDCGDTGWGGVPLGCSAQSGGDWAGHYKVSGVNCPVASYQLVCVADGAPPLSPPPAPTMSHPPPTSPLPLGHHMVEPGTGTIQSALDISSSGDTLILKDGSYLSSGAREHGCSQVVKILKDITIRAQNPGNAILDGENARRVVWIIAGTVVIEGLQVTRGRKEATCSSDHPNGPSAGGVRAFPPSVRARSLIPLHAQSSCWTRS